MKYYKKYRDVVLYAFFGILTTFLNIIVYWLCAHILKMPIMASTILAWVCAVFFAFVTNKKWVFHSMSSGARDMAKEVVAFFVCRLTTGFVDWGCMLIFVSILQLNDVAVKIFANIVVIVLNYLASKYMIFKVNR